MSKIHVLPLEVVSIVLKDFFESNWLPDTQAQIEALADTCPKWIPIMVKHIKRKTLLCDAHGILRDDALTARFQTLFYLREREMFAAGVKPVAVKEPNTEDLAEIAKATLNIMDRDRIKEVMSVRNFTTLTITPLVPVNAKSNVSLIGG